MKHRNMVFFLFWNTLILADFEIQFNYSGIIANYILYLWHLFNDIRTLLKNNGFCFLSFFNIKINHTDGKSYGTRLKKIKCRSFIFKDNIRCKCKRFYIGVAEFNNN